MNDELMADLARLPDVEVAPRQPRTRSVAIWIDGREVIHSHREWIEVRLTGKLIDKLDDERAMRRARTSDWVMVDGSHRDLVLDLARKAVEVNRGAH